MLTMKKGLLLSINLWQNPKVEKRTRQVPLLL